MSDLLYSVADAKISIMLADGTYGPAIDVPGIQEVTLKPKTKAVDVRGDNGKYASHLTTESMNVEVKWAAFDASIFAGVTGASLESATGSWEIEVTDSDVPAYFKLEAVTPLAADGSNVYITFPKLLLTESPDMVGLVGEKFKEQSIAAEAFRVSGTYYVFGKDAEGRTL